MLADDDKKYFCIIKIEETEKHLLFQVNDFKKEISLPVDLNFLSSEILKLIIDINLPIRDFKYFPYQRLVENDKKTIPENTEKWVPRKNDKKMEKLFFFLH